MPEDGHNIRYPEDASLVTFGWVGEDVDELKHTIIIIIDNFVQLDNC